MQAIEKQLRLLQRFEHLLQCPIIFSERIGRGRNSRTYKIISDNGVAYAAKVYFRHRADRRNRLQTEYESLKFLRANGLNNVPSPVLAAHDDSIAIYHFIEGEAIASKTITGWDVECAVDFLHRLWQLKDVKGAKLLPKASEACFSVQAIVNNISARFSKFSTVKKPNGLAGFLHQQFEPAFHEITTWVKKYSEKCGLSFKSEIPHSARTLSPSDFGFHNALRRPDGTITFLDFEYFGWDDPAKTVVDFLLHPGMKLSKQLQKKFVAIFLDKFIDCERLRERIELVFPLFGLKWCLILLNEFVPADLVRRQFAGFGNVEIEIRFHEQLGKAEQMLSQVLSQNYHLVPHLVPTLRVGMQTGRSAS